MLNHLITSDKQNKSYFYYEDDLNDDFTRLVNTRRLLPPIQMFYNTLLVSKSNDSKISFAYRPNNCTINLAPVTLKQSFQEKTLVLVG